MMMKQRRIGKLVICDALNLIDESKKFNNEREPNRARVDAIIHVSDIRYVSSPEARN